MAELFNDTKNRLYNEDPNKLKKKDPYSNAKEFSSGAGAPYKPKIDVKKPEKKSDPVEAPKTAVDAIESTIMDPKLNEQFRDTLAKLSTAAAAAEKAYEEEAGAAQAEYGKEKQNLKKRELAESLTNAVGQIVAGLYGTKTGLSMGGTQFNEKDWEAKANAALAELDSKLGTAGEKYKQRVGRNKDALNSALAMYRGNLDMELAKERTRRQGIKSKTTRDVAELQAGAKKMDTERAKEVANYIPEIEEFHIDRIGEAIDKYAIKDDEGNIIGAKEDFDTAKFGLTQLFGQNVFSDMLASSTGFENELNARDVVQAAAIRQIKDIMGARPTDKDMELLLSTVFSSGQDSTANLKKMEFFLNQLKAANNQKKAWRNRFEMYGSTIPEQEKQAAAGDLAQYLASKMNDQFGGEGQAEGTQQREFTEEQEADIEYLMELNTGMTREKAIDTLFGE